jgi:hypothetical protein
MAISILQTPASASLAQSPIIFSVTETNTALLQNDDFQYIGELYYWTGSLTNSGSTSDYTMQKFPNISLSGIFDLNRIINSTLTDLAQVNTSNVMYFAVDFYHQYYSGSSYVTGSHVKSQTYKALDGYGLFQEPIGQQIFNKTPYWPLMTDGPATQSCLVENYGSASVYTGNAGTTPLPDRIYYNSSLGTSAFYLLSATGSNSSSLQIDEYPIGPQESEFPFGTTGLDWFTVQAYSGSSAPIGQSIKFNVVCNQKYPNVRIKWKNRYGQFDWFNFNMVNRQSFNTERRTYQPQLGTWQSPTLQYNNYDSSVLNYISDSKQAISVNTDWVDDAYNEIFKQLLVSDEIYWIYDEAANDLRPITINTSSITFKTGVVDKVIQYSFDFNWGQAYKLII